MSKPTPAHKLLAQLGVIPKAANAKVYEGDANKRLSGLHGLRVEVEFIRSGKALHAAFYDQGRWLWTALNLPCDLEEIEREAARARQSLARITLAQQEAA